MGGMARKEGWLTHDYGTDVLGAAPVRRAQKSEDGANANASCRRGPRSTNLASPFRLAMAAIKGPPHRATNQKGRKGATSHAPRPLSRASLPPLGKSIGSSCAQWIAYGPAGQIQSQPTTFNLPPEGCFFDAIAWSQDEIILVADKRTRKTHGFIRGPNTSLFSHLPFFPPASPPSFRTCSIIERDILRTATPGDV